MGAAKIKKGDKVIVLSGKDKGKTGEVTRAMPKDGKVAVSGGNVRTRHPQPAQADPPGGLQRPAPARPPTGVAYEAGGNFCRPGIRHRRRREASGRTRQRPQSID